MYATIGLMDAQALIAIGLTPMQAEAYVLLIEHGTIKPPDAATLLKTTRTNAYKVLDKLVELQLATKVPNDKGKKNLYAATNPLSLTTLTRQYRAEATAREEAVSNIMHELLAKYHTHADKPQATVVTGRKEVAEAYRKQLSLNENIFFVHTRADIPMMGFDTMHQIRVTPARNGKKRQAIMTAKGKDHGPINYEQHRRSNLEITWALDADYNAPVEWSVTESSLLIVLYATEPHAIFIADKVVAGAFLQLWKLLSSLLQKQPLHQALKSKY